jgi:TolB-like protein
MPSSLKRRIQQLAKDFRDRGVVRAGIVYGTVALTGLGMLDLVRDLWPWLDRVFPVLVLGAVFAFPVVLILSWVFDVGPGGIHLHHDPGTDRASTGYRIGAGAAVALASVVFGWTILTLWDRAEARPDGAEPGSFLDPTRIAVLYFDDHSPSRDLGFLANGLTEDLINELANVDALQVTSRNGVKAFRDDPPGVGEIARRLNVGTLVEGSVTGDQERVRVTVQLIDGRSDAHLMSRQFDADQGDLFSLQDELSNAIAIALREHLGMSIREEEERSRTASTEAWTAYHEATALYDRAGRLTQETDRREMALSLYESVDSLLAVAERADPSWADPPVQRGWVALASSLVSTDFVGYVQPGDSAALLQVAERAVRISDGSAAALELRGVVAFEIAEATGDKEMRERAEADLRAALELEPDRARALAHLSDIRRIAGDFGSARLYAERALAADAFLEDADRVMYRLFSANVELRDWDEAERWCAAGRRNHPDDSGFVLCRLFLIALRPGAQDPEAAWAVVDTLRAEASPHDWEQSYRTWAGYQVARVLALSSLPDSAEAVLAAYRPEEAARPDFAYDEANVRLALGDREGALDLLELYLTVAPDRAEYLASDWLFEELWGDPRFVEMTGSG